MCEGNKTPPNRRLPKPGASDDGKFARYNHATKRWETAEAGSGGGTESSLTEIQNKNSTNSSTFVSPRRFWAGITQFLSEAWTFSAKITFTTAPRFTAPGALKFLKTDINRDLIGLDKIAIDDVDTTEEANFVSDAEKATWNAKQAALGFTPENSANKNQAGGYVGLNVSGTIDLEYINAAILGGLNYKGTWNADTNTPTIPAAATGNKGYFYIVSVSGATEIDGIDEWAQRDWIVSNGTAWEKADHTDAVGSVFGRVGNIAANAGDYTADQITETSTKEFVTPEQKTTWNGKENAANKATDFSTVNNTLFPTVQATDTQIDAKYSATSVIVDAIHNGTTFIDAAGTDISATFSPLNNKVALMLQSGSNIAQIRQYTGTGTGTSEVIGIVNISKSTGIVNSTGERFTAEWVSSEHVITILGQTAFSNKENAANKATNFTTVNDTLFPTTEAVVEEINASLAEIDDTTVSSNTTLSASSPHIIYVSAAATISLYDTALKMAHVIVNIAGEGADVTVKNEDDVTIATITPDSSGTFHRKGGTEWTLIG